MVWAIRGGFGSGVRASGCSEPRYYFETVDKFGAGIALTMRNRGRAISSGAQGSLRR